MNEKVNPFNPSKTEIAQTYVVISAKLLATKSMEDEVTVKAFDLAVMVSESVQLLETIRALTKALGEAKRGPYHP